VCTLEYFPKEHEPTDMCNRDAYCVFFEKQVALTFGILDTKIYWQWEMYRELKTFWDVFMQTQVLIHGKFQDDLGFHT
jgi:hypothetical protein